tara:strand:- start:1105 stop:1893 length:789 start_codon:yes stop_codon:yes gene_type:complete
MSKEDDLRKRLLEYIETQKPGYAEKKRAAREEARRKKPAKRKKKTPSQPEPIDKAKDARANIREEARRKKPAKKKPQVDTFKVAGEKVKAKKASKKVDAFESIPTPDVEDFKGPSTHKVKKGDTLSAIAKRMGTTIKALMAANPSIKNANMIRIGQTIKGPIGSAASPYKGMKKGELAKSKKKAEQDKRARLEKRLSNTIVVDPNYSPFQSGGMIGQSDMSAKKVAAPKKNKKKIPQYYKGGGMIKAGKKYAYGGRVAKYKE